MDDPTIEGKWTISFDNSGNNNPADFEIIVDTHSHINSSKTYEQIEHKREQIGERDIKVGTKDVKIGEEQVQIGEKTVDVDKSVIDGEPIWIQCAANDGDGANIDRYNCTPQALNISKLAVDPTEQAAQSLEALDIAIKNVSSYRSRAGAQQNRLEHTNNYLAVAYMNLQDACSRITDTDMARETLEFAKANILTEAGSAMLAQANQDSQRVLQLLK